MPADIPLSVWPTAQRNAKAQRAGRYVEISGHHPAKMLPAIAARAIATYSAPGDLVCDPMAGIGSTLVEAVHLGRDAIGVEYEANWADLARANIAYARGQGATGHGEVVCGDARHLPGAVHLGQLDLVGPDQPAPHDVDEMARRQVPGEEQLTGTTLEPAQVDLAAVEPDVAGLETVHLSDRDEQVAAADVDDEPDDGRVRALPHPDDHVLDPSDAISLAVDERAPDHARQMERLHPLRRHDSLCLHQVQP